MLTKMKHIRQVKGYRQKQVAALLQISRSYMCMLENGEAKPTDEILKRLSGLYGVHVRDLVD